MPALFDEDVEAPEFLDSRGDQFAHGVALGHIGAIVDGAHAVIALDPAADRLDLAGIAKTIQHDIGAEPGQLLGDPSPMPLVDPVTMATLPFNMGIPFDVLRNESAGRSIAAMDVMRDDAELGRRRIQAPRIGQRAADVVQPALPMSAHRAQPEFVVLSNGPRRSWTDRSGG